MAHKLPTVALIYDFDGTLSPKNMQEYDFLKAIGIKDKKAFWTKNAELIKKHDASNILCYMKLMLDKARAADLSVKREKFVEFGRSVELYPGVEDWFKRINDLGKRNGVKVKHYINSSGLKEMIEGTPIAKEFNEIYACSFMYDEDGVAVWPAVAVDFTTKTQFLFMINKGISRIMDNSRVNEYKPESERPVPFSHMIYFGDGETDIPCMKLVKQQGGISIAVYRPRDPKKKACAEKLINEQRVNFACKADYSIDSDMYSIVEQTIRRIKTNYDFLMLEKSNQGKIEKSKAKSQNGMK